MTLPDESDRPRQLVEHAGAAGMRVIEQALADSGAKAEHIFVLIHASGTPAGELDCTAAGQGYEDGRELLAELLSHAGSMAKAMGLEMHIVPQVHQGGQG
jgi:hypothetical protein